MSHCATTLAWNAQRRGNTPPAPPSGKARHAIAGHGPSGEGDARELTRLYVADPTARLCRYFGTYMEDVGLLLRGTFIIDPEGILKVMDIHGNSIGRSAEEILRKLQAASFVHQHQGEVCPASWKPAKKP